MLQILWGWRGTWRTRAVPLKSSRWRWAARTDWLDFSAGPGACRPALREPLGACASALPAEDIREAVRAAGELTGLMRDGAALASALGADTGDIGRTLGQIDACLFEGKVALDRCAPVLQSFSAGIAARETFNVTAGR